MTWRAIAAAAFVLHFLTPSRDIAAQNDRQPPDARQKRSQSAAPPADAPPQGINVFSFEFDDSRASPGYNLMSPMNSSRTYLFDAQGSVVRCWQSDCSPALCAYLLDNGHVLRGGAIGDESQVFGPGPGVGGRVQEFNWDGELVWDFYFFNARQIQHHDVAPLPNGNVLMLVWDRKTSPEARAAGRRPELTSDSHLLVDSLVEVRPTGKTTGEVVWKWHLWDHLVQDFDRRKPHYGNVAQHPELVDLNYSEDANPDWTHANSVAYNAALDQVMLSVRSFNELWIIDHSTTTAEAASHQGGRGGKGGDLLYRWGNPHAYRAGKKTDQKLFSQHNAHWIDKGLPGDGHVLVFNNGANRPDGSYSSVDELALPLDSHGLYRRRPGAAYGPDSPAWSYTAPKRTDFYSYYISGAQRLPNGNTLICSGAEGILFEVTPEKEIVWKFTNPINGERGGWGGFGPSPRPGQVLTPIARVLLAISPEQAPQLDALQRHVDRRLAGLLTAEQNQQLREPQPRRSDSLGSSYELGQVLATADERRLMLSDEQTDELAALQKYADGHLDKVLTEAQREQAKSGFALPTPPPDGPAIAESPTQPGQPAQGAPQWSNAMPVFRVYRYAANHPGLANKNLIPGKSMEDLEASEPDPQDRPGALAP